MLMDEEKKDGDKKDGEEEGKEHALVCEEDSVVVSRSMVWLTSIHCSHLKKEGEQQVDYEARLAASNLCLSKFFGTESSQIDSAVNLARLKEEERMKKRKMERRKMQQKKKKGKSTL